MGFKVNKGVAKTKNKARFSTQIISLGVAGVLIAGVLIANYVSSAPMRDVVEIAVLKNSSAKGTLLSSNMFEKTTMVRSDYEKAAYVKLADGSTKRQIILYDDIKYIVGKYTTNYIRGGTALYYDEFSKETTKSNSYLYQMDGTELLKLSIKPTEFGDMVVPGDKLNIRVSYKEQIYELPTYEEYKQQVEMGISGATTVTRNELLFSEVTVLDMLNKAGESIFDKYYELISLPESQQKKTFASDDFQKSIEPASILVAVTPEEAERYAKIGSSSISLVTLLPRTSSNLILDAISSLSQGSSAK